MLAKIGPGPELELALLLVVDRQAGDVGRLQVGRALDARRVRAPSIDCAIARASTVFAVPGTSSKQHVAAAEECADHEPDLLPLTTDDELDVLEQALGEARGFCQLGVQLDVLSDNLFSQRGTSDPAVQANSFRAPVVRSRIAGSRPAWAYRAERGPTAQRKRLAARRATRAAPGCELAPRRLQVALPRFSISASRCLLAAAP